MADETQAGRRLGRPKEADSAATKRRILDVARAAFASGGYDSSTNRDLAAQVGITAGALYYYYPSKLDLYLAVHEDVQQRVYGRFNEAVDGARRFLDAFDSVLDVAHQLNEADPTIAAFIGVTRADMRRHAEISASLADHTERRNAFFERRGTVEGRPSQKGGSVSNDETPTLPGVRSHSCPRPDSMRLQYDHRRQQHDGSKGHSGRVRLRRLRGHGG